MALTTSRWLVVSIAACVVIWWGVLPRVSSPRRLDAQDDDRSARALSLAPVTEGILAQANDRLRRLELRDSVVGVSTLQSEPLSVAIDAALPASVRAALEKSIAAQWSALGIAASPNRAATTIAVIVDSGRTAHGLPRVRRFNGAMVIDAFLPGPSTHNRCIGLARLMGVPQPGDRYGDIVIRNITSRETVDALLNPCALLAAFGEPGPYVAQWLFDSRWSRAQVAGWNAAPSPWNANYRADDPRVRLAERLSFSNDRSWQARYFLAPEGIACLAGEPGRCEQVLTGVRHNAADSIWRHSVVASTPPGLASFYFANRATALGPAEGWIVSEMVRTLGAARFQRFWQSTLPLPGAFKSAAGEDLDAWVREWGRRMYGDAAVGPVISLLGVSAGAFILVAGVLLAIVIERRRRVA